MDYLVSATHPTTWAECWIADSRLCIQLFRWDLRIQLRQSGLPNKNMPFAYWVISQVLWFCPVCFVLRKGSLWPGLIWNSLCSSIFKVTAVPPPLTPESWITGFTHLIVFLSIVFAVQGTEPETKFPSSPALKRWKQEWRETCGPEIFFIPMVSTILISRQSESLYQQIQSSGISDPGTSRVPRKGIQPDQTRRYWVAYNYCCYC